MTKEVFRYRFNKNVPFDDVETSLLLAVLSTESLHGEAEVRLRTGYSTSAEKRLVVISGDCQVGQDLNRLFVGFLTREFGDDSFTVESIDTDQPQGAPNAAA